MAKPGNHLIHRGYGLEAPQMCCGCRPFVTASSGPFATLDVWLYCYPLQHIVVASLNQQKSFEPEHRNLQGQAIFGGHMMVQMPHT